MRIDKSNIVHAIEACFPNTIVQLYRDSKHKLGIYMLNLKYKRVVRRIQKIKSPINVVFLAISSSVWKYEYLYRLMESDSCFKPIILVCPQVNFGEQFMFKQIEDTVLYFTKKGYSVKSSYDFQRGDFIDIKELHPDILMYTNPYKGLIMDKYYINNVGNVLTCYISYYFPKGIRGYHKVLEPFERRLWLNFIATQEDYMNILYKNNCRLVGYPMFESFKYGSNTGYDWKIKDQNIKKIIWAPYHNLSRDEVAKVQISTFSKYAFSMLDLAYQYKNRAQFILKPHPLLRAKLSMHHDWGKEKTDEYFNAWIYGENTNLVEGEYIDLFNSSDALIHDCGSFAVEYLYEDKPVMYLAYDNKYTEHIEPLGIEALDCHEIAYNATDIQCFVQNICEEKEDAKREKREAFIERYLLPPNSLTASENMLNEIKNKLNI